MKNVKKIVALAMCAITSAGVVAGCTKQVGGEAGTLNVYCLLKGNGIEWCEVLLDEFQKQDWVQEKYPGLKINFEHDDLDATLSNQLNLGSTSKFDLLFSQYAHEWRGDPVLADLTDTVYNSTVPGEGDTKVIDKLLPGFADANSYINANGEKKYDSYSYVNTMYGIMYNATLLEELNFEVPRTTDELLGIMADVKALNGTNAKYPYTHSIMNRANGYCYRMFPTWWAQYEGITEYENYFNGISGEDISVKVIKQQGRLEALKVMENMYKFTNGYIIPDAPSIDYLNAQLSFMRGNGLFHFNGDYFDTEMKAYEAAVIQQGYNYELKFMKMPVISSIVERLTSIKTAATNMGKTNDEMLALLIDDIDANKVECAYTANGVSQADYDELKEARNIVNASTGASAVIPSCAINQDIAADVLRFMATDIANEKVLLETSLTMPFKMDFIESKPELKAQINSTKITKIEMYLNKTIPVTIVRDESGIGLGRYGLTPLKSQEFNNKVAFESLFGLEKGFKTAQQVYDEEIAYWNADRWDQVLMAAGLA